MSRDRRPRAASALAFLVLLVAMAGTSVVAMAGGPITSAQTVNGSLATPTTVESWTFSGTVGQRILVAALTTAGGMNTNVVLKAPGGAVAVNTSADRVEFQLTSTGTWTIEITDYTQTASGTYEMSFLNITAGPLTSGTDTDGGPIASNETKNGSMQSMTDFDAFTFAGTVGQRVLVAALATAGAGYNTNITIYPPGGGPAENYTSADRLDHQLAANGTYTIVIEDYANDHAGGYTISFLNLTAGPLTSGPDPDGGTIASNEIKTGNTSTLGDFDTWTFSGTTGQRVLIAAVTTSGTANTNIALYPPNGGAAVVFTSADRVDYQLVSTGTWSIVIEDLNNDHTGGYTMSYFNVTAGPHTTGADTDGGAIASNTSLDRSIQSLCDFDAYTFSGHAGDRVVFAALATAGASFNTNITIYPPGGGAAENYTSSDRLDHQLLLSGTYTVVVEDYNNDHTGSYTLSFVNVTYGPLTTPGGDTDGGAIASNEIKARGLQTLGDFDAYRFMGTFGQRVLIAAVSTGGASNTNIALYPPNGGAAVVFTSADRVDYQLTMTGLWTIVIEDLGNDQTGTYTLSYFNVTSGPFDTGDDADGGTIASNGAVSRSIQSLCDFDAWTFSGSAGQRVLITAVATGGANFNTNIAIYPPGGGTVENYTSSDRLDTQLLQTGTYTIVIEDYNNDHTGSYVMTFLNVTTGPYTTGADSTGGPIASNQVRNGKNAAIGDMDGYTFSGTFGQRILISAVSTAGAGNTNISLYPPGGGAAVVNSSADRVDYQLTATGTWTIVIEDYLDDNTGDYTLSYFNVTAGPFTNAADGNGGAIASNVPLTGASQTLCDFDAYTFAGTAGDRVVFAAVTTGGASHNTAMTLYPPNGGAYEASTSADRMEAQLLQTGTYTLVVEDYQLDHTGTYALSFVNLTAGPITSAGDADGGSIATGAVKNGLITPVPDLDTYRFGGTIGDTVRVNCTTTSGAMNTNIMIYAPGGGAPVVNTSADQITYVLLVSGLFSLVIEDYGDDETGGYNMTFTKSGSVIGVGGPGGPPIADGVLDPAHAVLLPAAPTPFARGASTTLVYSLPVARSVRLVVFDARGARVRALASGERPAGVHRVAWDGLDDTGRAVRGGVYYARLEAGPEVVTQKLVRVD